MIPRQELLDLAADFGLAPNVVEKDYALGWLLAGFGEHPDTRDSWLFKGGTCLKKCFFETYRLSFMRSRRLSPATEHGPSLSNGAGVSCGRRGYCSGCVAITPGVEVQHSGASGTAGQLHENVTINFRFSW